MPLQGNIPWPQCRLSAGLSGNAAEKFARKIALDNVVKPDILLRKMDFRQNCQKSTLSLCLSKIPVQGGKIGFGNAANPDFLRPEFPRYGEYILTLIVPGVVAKPLAGRRIGEKPA